MSAAALDSSRSRHAAAWGTWDQLRVHVALRWASHVAPASHRDVLAQCSVTPCPPTGRSPIGKPWAEAVAEAAISRASSGGRCVGGPKLSSPDCSGTRKRSSRLAGVWRNFRKPDRFRPRAHGCRTDVGFRAAAGQSQVDFDHIRVWCALRPNFDSDFAGRVGPTSTDVDRIRTAFGQLRTDVGQAWMGSVGPNWAFFGPGRGRTIATKSADLESIISLSALEGQNVRTVAIAVPRRIGAACGFHGRPRSHGAFAHDFAAMAATRRSRAFAGLREPGTERIA